MSTHMSSKRHMTKNHLLKEYQKAIKKEGLQVSVSADELYGIMLQLSEIAYSILVPRSYSTRYNLTTHSDVFESVASHSFFLENLVDNALTFLYGPDFNHTLDGFTYREVLQAVRRHDLPENVITDIPDNGNRNDEFLAWQENYYWSEFAKESPRRETDTEDRVMFLLKDSRFGFTTTTGSMIHAADKASAIFVNLCLEEKGCPPIMATDDPQASKIEYDIMQKCERHLHKDNKRYCFASEMWTKFFFQHNNHKLDYGKYFTALLIMKTIAVTGKWYDHKQTDSASN